MNEYDVVIVGGGMVGASFALALRSTKLRTLLVEGVSPDSAAQPRFARPRLAFRTAGVLQDHPDEGPPS